MEWRIDTTGVILLMATGIHYVNQAGGIACKQPTAEGAFIPLDFSYRHLEHHFCGPKYGSWCCDGIDAETADMIDREPDMDTYRILVDRSRLKESMEAWVYCTLKGKPGVLVWPNSD